MPKVVFDKLNFTHLTPTPMHLQLADSSVRYPEGIAEDIPVRVRKYFIPVDFVVLNMEISKETMLILRRPFLSTAGAQIDVRAGEIRFNISGKEEKFPFQPRKEQSTMIKIKYGLNTQGIREVEIIPPKTDNLFTFMKEFMREKEKMDKRTGKGKNQKAKPKPHIPKST
ncbi:uncharacterized protein LOC112892660 [Panicum hallii]|jgi:hypothetical protein|uniref:uncharacterized protein LOC112892660 n=1 Tax=Panicum hallii TaxID=206008 RepID=UPI000DF4EF53|nr:uncharacterized protein LOC112892660 [Panicum hallii]